MYYDFDAVHILDISVINIAYKSLLRTVQSGIDACKYQFLKACSDKALCFFEDFWRSSWPDAASCKRYNAVGAEPVAALLYFNICSGPWLHWGYRAYLLICIKLLIGFHLSDFAAVFDIFLNKRYHSWFLVGARNYIHALYCRNLLRRHLYIAACNSNGGIRVYGSGAPYKLSGFAVGKVCYGAGVDYIRIGKLRIRHYLVPRFFEVFFETLGFILIDLAA